MPKLRSHDPAVEDRKRDLRDRYGGFMSLTDVAKELGCKSRNTAAKAVRTIPSYAPTGVKVYDVADIAKLIERSRVPAEATRCGTS